MSCLKRPSVFDDSVFNQAALQLLFAQPTGTTRLDSEKIGVFYELHWRSTEIEGCSGCIARSRNFAEYVTLVRAVLKMRTPGTRKAAARAGRVRKQATA